MTDETNEYIPSFARRLVEDASRRKCFAITQSEHESEPTFDWDDFEYFRKRVGSWHDEAVFTLRRKNFKGLGTKNPTIRLLNSAEWRPLHLRAARIVVKYIGKTGDPEDRPFPGRFTVIKLVPWRKEEATTSAEGDAA
jgi:hypothetical protein